MDVPGNPFYINSVNKGFDWSKEDWCDVAGQELLQDEPNYVKWIAPNTWRVVMYSRAIGRHHKPLQEARSSRISKSVH